VEKKEYEVAVLYHPDLEIDLDKPLKKVEKVLVDNGGNITNVDNWGKRKLAYPIKKQDHAVYVFYTVELPGESVSKIESTLNITDEVIRFLIVKPDPRIKEALAAREAEAEAAGAEQDEAEDKGDTTEDEAEDKGDTTEDEE